MRIRFVAVIAVAIVAAIGSEACSTSSSSSSSGATLKCTPVGQKDGNCPKDTPNTQADYNDCTRCSSLRQTLLDCLTKQGYVFALGCDADGYTNVVNKPTDAQAKACQSQANAFDACNSAQDDAGVDAGGADSAATDSAAQDSAAQDSAADDSSTGDDGGDAGTD